MYINTCPLDTAVRNQNARVAQLVEHDLAKVGAAGSSPVSCSRKTKKRTSKRMSFFFASEPRPELEDSRSSLSFRSSQSKRPPDVLRRLMRSKTLSGGCGYFLGLSTPL